MTFRGSRSRSIEVSTLLIAVVLSVGDHGLASDATPEQVAFFEAQVRPLLVEKCFRCHGPEKQESELRLDSRETLAQGGESGPVVVPGHPDESPLIQAVNYESLEMPPDGKLSDEQIATLTHWVKIGAPWPTHRPAPSPVTKITDEDRRYWAFQPLASPTLPDVEDGGWCTNSIDRFI